MKIILTGLLIICCVINDFGQTLPKDNYDVYEVVLNEIYKDYLKSSKKSYIETFPFVILDKTKIIENSAKAETIEDAELQNYLNELFPPEEMKKFDEQLEKLNVNEDFYSKNKSAVTLRKFFPINYRYNLASESKVTKLLESGKKYSEKQKKKGDSVRYGNWSIFYKSFPNSQGYYQFSRIGFSPTNDFARVNVNGAGYQWSSSAIYILNKVNEKWVIYDRQAIYTVS